MTKMLMKMSAAVLLAASLSGAAFAQAGANPNAPQPNSAGTGVIQPGTTSTGEATSSHRRTGTVGMSGTDRLGGNNAELGGNNGNSAAGSNSLSNPNNTTGPH
jgi:hypothetical protein